MYPFSNYEAALIVLGGTVCAIFVNYPMSQVFGLVKVLKKVLTTTGEDTSEIVTTFVNFAKKGRTEGFLALEGDVKSLKNDFLKRGVQLVIDGSDQEFIRNMMETEVGFIEERHKVGAEIFNSLGTYSPAFGIIGTVLGMVLMLNSISNVEEVPRRMALCLAAAFFGLNMGTYCFSRWPASCGGALKKYWSWSRSSSAACCRSLQSGVLQHHGSEPVSVPPSPQTRADPENRMIHVSESPQT